MAITFKSVVPVLRMFDLDATLAFYRNYLGCEVDWQEGEPDGPVYLQVSRGAMVFQLSSHHGDGTPGSAVLVYTESLADLHRELHGKPYAFFNPGMEPYGSAQVMTLIDPASNLLRFFQQAGEG